MLTAETYMDYAVALSMFERLKEINELAQLLGIRGR